MQLHAPRVTVLKVCIFGQRSRQSTCRHWQVSLRLLQVLAACWQPECCQCWTHGWRWRQHSDTSLVNKCRMHARANRSVRLCPMPAWKSIGEVNHATSPLAEGITVIAIGV